MQDKLTWALPRADGCSRYSLPVFADGTRNARASADLAGTTCWNMLKPRNVRTWRWRYQFAGWVGWTLWISLNRSLKFLKKSLWSLHSFTIDRFIPFHTVSNSEDMGQSVRMVPVRRSHPAKDVAAWRQKSHPPWPTEALPIPPGVLLCRRFRSAHQLHPATKLEVAIICNHSNNSDD